MMMQHMYQKVVRHQAAKSCAIGVSNKHHQGLVTAFLLSSRLFPCYANCADIHVSLLVGTCQERCAFYCLYDGKFYP